jgi:glycosyltransferase involved in cell wall biosynthesis
MFSAVILTLDEEKALPKCLQSLAGCDDIVVLDSGSTDNTVTIAKSAGARVFSRKFDTFAAQRNYAQRSVEFRNPWVFHLDADEQMTETLSAECHSAATRSDLDGFRVAPKMIFEGRWIRHCTDYPAYQARFVRAPGFEFIQAGHGQREAPNMRIETLHTNYLHDISIYGEDSWLAKHRRYARAEALKTLEHSEHESWRDIYSPSALLRRRALKRLSFSLPCRPTLRFVYQFILRRGFLDGPQGLRYCRLLAQYEGFIAEEIEKLKVTTAGGTH